jgi:hypothetical protein
LPGTYLSPGIGPRTTLTDFLSHHLGLTVTGLGGPQVGYDVPQPPRTQAELGLLFDCGIITPTDVDPMLFSNHVLDVAWVSRAEAQRRLTSYEARWLAAALDDRPPANYVETGAHTPAFPDSQLDYVETPVRGEVTRSSPAADQPTDQRWSPISRALSNSAPRMPRRTQRDPTVTTRGRHAKPA